MMWKRKKGKVYLMLAGKDQMLSPLGISRCEAVPSPTSTIIRTRNSAIDNSAAFTDFNAYGSPPYIGRVFFSFFLFFFLAPETQF